MSLLPAMIAAAVAWVGLAILVANARRLPLDRPNARSLHAHVVPRVGGIAIWAGWLAGTVWLPAPKAWVAPFLALVAISLLDDHRGVHPGLRLALHIGAAAAWVWLAAPAVNPVVAVLVIVWMANLYNFMDGSDGLAGAMAVIGFGAYALGGWLAASPMSAPFLAIAAAATPFLVYNLPPARVFLGDAGSVPMGFLAAIFGITGWLEGWWPAWFPVLAFLPFIADASVTLAARLLRGARVWEAHRDHSYQRLVQSGWGHARTLALYAALMVGTAGSAVGTLVWAPGAGVAAVAAWAAILALVFGVIEYHWRRRGIRFEESKG
jgi:UDP-N-acetylmuramyl pentapeptide phosphotransferase/UDP-N-acetylglucosamine-1-phosphate transferase